MNLLDRALVELAAVLDGEGVPYMVIGGYANLVWGSARLTRDLDLTIELEDSRLGALITILASKYTVLPPDPEKFCRETRVLPMATDQGVRVDLIVAGLPYEEQAIRRAVNVAVGGRSVRVCTAEDLIIHKLVSDRPRDREDVESVIRRQGPKLNRNYLDPIVQGLSVDLERPEIWSFYEGCVQQQ